MFKRQQQDEKEKENEKGFIQKIKEMDKDILVRIGAGIVVILLVTVLAFIKVHKKEDNSELIRIVKEKTMKNSSDDKLILNETYKLNQNNFEIYISKNNESKGLILIRPSDFIKNNNKLVLSNSIKNLTISGNSDIIKHLSWSLSTNYYVNVSNNNINITLNDNSNSTELLLKINSDLFSKEQIISDAPLIYISYMESYAD